MNKRQERTKQWRLGQSRGVVASHFAEEVERLNDRRSDRQLCCLDTLVRAGVLVVEGRESVGLGGRNSCGLSF